MPAEVVPVKLIASGGLAKRVVPIAEVEIGERIRRPRPERVEAIRRAIREEGQRQPIEIAPKSGGAGYRLVSGCVRIAALLAEGAETVEAVIRRGSEAERRQREIDDNLLQDGSTVLDRVRYLAAAKKLYEAQHPETRHGGVRRGDQAANLGELVAFSVHAAQVYGFARRSIERGCTIGVAIGDEAADLIAGTDYADNQSALEKLCRFSPAQQARIAAMITGERPISLGEAIDAVTGVAPVDTTKKAWSAATGGWSRLGARDRRDWLRTIATDLPTGVRLVFDEDA